MKSFAVISILLWIPQILAFNISPSPNIILKIPVGDEGPRSSYFGFSITLRKSHILIGAPRANSTIHDQIKEPGMIYKCEFNDKDCERYFMDKLGDIVKPDYIHNEKKEYRLLGFSMDGSENEKDPFVTCAPKSLTPSLYKNEYVDSHMFGVCYWKPNTNDKSSEVTKITPLRNHNLLLKYENVNETRPFYRFGESGFSVHISENNQEILLGAPGLYNWMGTAIEYKIKKAKENNYHGKVADNTNFDSGFKDSLKFNSYFGYSMTSGQFLKPKHDELFYVASAPRMDDGLAMIFQINNKFNIDYMQIYKKFYGTQLGSYFGYSIICDDFNNDKKPDIVISAPFLRNKQSEEVGGIFIYMNDCSDDKNGSNYDCFKLAKQV